MLYGFMLFPLLLWCSAMGVEDDPYLSPAPHPDAYFAEHFDDASVFDRRWTRSSAKKEGIDAAIAKYDGEWERVPSEKDALPGDHGLVLKSKAKHSAISSRLHKPFLFKDRDSPLVVQYEINFQNGQDCGGGYIKLLSQSPDFEPKNFNDKTPYTIMFGPDKCGSDSKLHFIFRHVNPKNGSIQEKHVKKLDTKDRSIFEEALKSKRPHLYRLVLRPDSSYEISLDYKVINRGSLFQDFEPALNPEAQIDDPNDFKPSDWDEREKIADTTAVKPDDWDETQPRQIPDKSAVKPEGWLDNEPTMIPDPSASRPDDWDDEIDGEWEAPLLENALCASAPGCGEWAPPMIDNPLYKGRWIPPLITNPNYKGKWKARKIDNPDYYLDGEPFARMTPVGGVGIELWSMSDGLYFDNILIAHSLENANKWATETFDIKVRKLDANDAGLFGRILRYSNRNPWLYAVYVVVVGLPLVLIITFCCSGDSKKTSDDPKKTDEPQDDDEVEEEEVKDEVEEEEEVVDNDDDEEPLVSEEKKNSPRRRRTRKE